MVMMVMVMMVVAIGSRRDADINASAVMVMVMMPDHNLGGPGAGALCQTLIVGFQQGQGVRDRVEKVAR
jgi:hypothetical protein